MYDLGTVFCFFQKSISYISLSAVHQSSGVTLLFLLLAGSKINLWKGQLDLCKQDFPCSPWVSSGFSGFLHIAKTGQWIDDSKLDSSQLASPRRCEKDCDYLCAWCPVMDSAVTDDE